VATAAAWVANNWFSLLQSLGIIMGMLFTALSLRRSTKARKASDLLTLTKHHRELWSEVYQRPELRRILSTNVDLVASPITVVEQEFLNVVVVHFNTGWLLARDGSLLRIDGLEGDVRSFFSLPLPMAIWNQTRQNRDAEFVRFVEGCLGNRDAEERGGIVSRHNPQSLEP
jgi:hypothetical protein